MNYPSKHNLASELVDRFFPPNQDSKVNTTTVIESLLNPVYEALLDAEAKVALLKSQKDHLTRMEEEQRMLANQFRNKVAIFESTLLQIARADYRGNRSSEAVLAEEALKR